MLPTVWTKEEFDYFIAANNFHLAHIKKGEKERKECVVCQSINETWT